MGCLCSKLTLTVLGGAPIQVSEATKAAVLAEHGDNFLLRTTTLLNEEQLKEMLIQHALGELPGGDAASPVKIRVKENGTVEFLGDYHYQRLADAPPEVDLTDPSVALEFAPKHGILKINVLSRPKHAFDLYTDSWSVAKLKDLIQDVEGMPPDQQRLMYYGQELDDDTKKCVEYGIIVDSVVDVQLRLRGGMFHVTSGRDGTFVCEGRQEPLVARPRFVTPSGRAVTLSVSRFTTMAELGALVAARL